MRSAATAAARPSTKAGAAGARWAIAAAATSTVVRKFSLTGWEGGEHYRQIARPFDWTFTRADLERVLAKITEREPRLALAA